jgi:nucleoid-associated protein YgaU
MSSRYDKYRIINNNISPYEFLRKERNIKNIRQYETPYIYNPTALDRARLKTTNHIWKYGDRFYQLAERYYGDVRYWWVIALYNGYMTESDIKAGDMLAIPLDLEEVLQVLETY